MNRPRLVFSDVELDAIWDAVAQYVENTDVEDDLPESTRARYAAAGAVLEKLDARKAALVPGVAGCGEPGKDGLTSNVAGARGYHGQGVYPEGDNRPMNTKQISYAAALDLVLRAMDANIAPHVGLLTRLADDVDATRESLIDAANDVARSMQRLAEAAAAGVHTSSTPNGAFARVGELNSQLRTQQEIFWRAVSALLGKDRYAEIRAAAFGRAAA